MTRRTDWPAIRRTLQLLAQLDDDILIGPLYRRGQLAGIGTVADFRADLLALAVHPDTVGPLAWAALLRRQRGHPLYRRPVLPHRWPDDTRSPT
ncbi:hypothetical protein GCM10010472_52170 [Pseudonocardia halophobica]|uniref:Uncharacterized protein n=1 Tax=Pseudonocardia halophobica TaxID=29401 RepID=A0A9W6NW80_9PSEU|nr:hypothetical protein [Pseudonocardia halophobica]GLL11353.1 hypothetical protein GCM10017577_24940 [Pseudonocardia halophobica]